MCCTEDTLSEESHLLEACHESRASIEGGQRDNIKNPILLLLTTYTHIYIYIYFGCLLQQSFYTVRYTLYIYKIIPETRNNIK